MLAGLSRFNRRSYALLQIFAPIFHQKHTGVQWLNIARAMCTAPSAQALWTFFREMN